MPVVDLCPHSPRPSCAVGFPDDEICDWLRAERGVKRPSPDAVLLQAARDIAEGEALTVDRAAMLGLEGDQEFADWFGHPKC